METITLHSRVGADGVLNLQVPIKAINADLEVVLIIQPVTHQPADSGWPTGFFEEVAGGWQGEHLVREDQGDYETRDELK